MVDSEFEVSNDSFDSFLVVNSGIMHELTDFIDYEWDVWSCYGQLLKTTNNTPKKVGLSKEVDSSLESWIEVVIGEEIGLELVMPVLFLKYQASIFPLAEEYTIG